MSFSIRCESTKTAFFLTEAEGSCSLEYIFSVHGSNRLGNRTAKSPRLIVQLERTISDGALSTTVKRSWRFASLDITLTSQRPCLNVLNKSMPTNREREREISHQKFASIIINRHKASIADTCSSGYWKDMAVSQSIELVINEKKKKRRYN